MQRKSLLETPVFRRVRFVLITSFILYCIGMLVLPISPFAADGYSIGGHIVTQAKQAEAPKLTTSVNAEVLADTQVILISIPDSKIVAKTVPYNNGFFAFDNLPPGEYLIQVLAPNYIVSKTTVVVGKETEEANQQLEIILIRPIDPGMGSSLEEGLSMIKALPAAGAGVNHAYGCISISLVFVQFQGSNTWTDADRNTAINAAQTAMTSLEGIAPEGAHVSTQVENFGTYTVTSPVGCTCGDADLWVDEVLQAAGYTTGSLDDRISAFSDDRSQALCGTNPVCGTCGVDSSNFLFFITRDDCGLWGGWNCSNRYLISYWNRSFGSAVYMHEVGHGFGAKDEYCVVGQDYCCGWFLTGPWGCDNLGGCLNARNDNCDPPCGTMCGSVDCQDGCPAANCTSHTACVMDGGGTLSFCPDSERQIGWVDSDGDLALDCLETACGTDPGNPNVFPDCNNLPPLSEAGGPYSADCQGVVTDVSLDGTGSSDPNGSTLSYMWTTTDCPGGIFDDNTSATPVLTVDTSPGCSVSCTVKLTVTDNLGATSDSTTEVNIADTTPPVVVCPADVTIECDQSTDPSNTGEATATDTCDSAPAVTYSDVETPDSCPAEKTITRTWTATDYCGKVTTCVQTIEVVDTTAPVISFNAQTSIIPPDAPISFTATATDNCDLDPSIEITGYDCFFLTKKGKRIDKKESCVVSIAGDTTTIVDSGGVNDHIEWYGRATDNCGNVTEDTFEITVVNPAK